MMSSDKPSLDIDEAAILANLGKASSPLDQQTVGPHRPLSLSTRKSIASSINDDISLSPTFNFDTSMTESQLSQSTPTFNIRRVRTNLPKLITAELKSWLSANTHNPYPTESQKKDMCKKYNLSLTQINNWFINARRRYLSRNDVTLPLDIPSATSTALQVASSLDPQALSKQQIGLLKAWQEVQIFKDRNQTPTEEALWQLSKRYNLTYNQMEELFLKAGLKPYDTGPLSASSIGSTSSASEPPSSTTGTSGPQSQPENTLPPFFLYAAAQASIAEKQYQPREPLELPNTILKKQVKTEGLTIKIQIPKVEKEKQAEPKRRMSIDDLIN